MTRRRTAPPYCVEVVRFLASWLSDFCYTLGMAVFKLRPGAGHATGPLFSNHMINHRQGHPRFALCTLLCTAASLPGERNISHHAEILKSAVTHAPIFTHDAHWYLFVNLCTRHDFSTLRTLSSVSPSRPRVPSSGVHLTRNSECVHTLYSTTLNHNHRVYLSLLTLSGLGFPSTRSNVSGLHPS